MRIHSSVALITNSSTVIYSTHSAGTAQKIRSFIDGILKAAGSDKTCDDLYRVELHAGEEYPTPWGEDGREDWVRIFDKATGEEVKDFQAILDTIHTEAFNDNF